MAAALVGVVWFVSLTAAAASGSASAVAVVLVAAPIIVFCWPT